MRQKQPREYLRARPELRTVERRVVAASELPLEFMLNALRLHDGFSSADFETRTGLSIETIGAQLSLAERKGLLVCIGERWHTTDLGRRFLNDVQALFLPAEGLDEGPSRSTSATVTTAASW